MAWRVCSAGCGELHQGSGRCPECRRAADLARRPHGNPYRTPGHQAFREAVLARDPVCVCMGDCGTHDGLCARRSTVADHWPDERVDLIDAGHDPDDPDRGRGVCKPCHDRKTARTKPGGWNDRL